MVCEAFVSSGFDPCVHAENGADALITAERVKPNAIILDISMPVMNGLEAAPRMRQILPNTPIILYTLYEPAKLAQVDVSKIGVSLARHPRMNRSKVSLPKWRVLFARNDPAEASLGVVTRAQRVRQSGEGETEEEVKPPDAESTKSEETPT